MKLKWYVMVISILVTVTQVSAQASTRKRIVAGISGALAGGTCFAIDKALVSGTVAFTMKSGLQMVDARDNGMLPLLICANWLLCYQVRKMLVNAIPTGPQGGKGELKRLATGACWLTYALACAYTFFTYSQ
jgi:hypothetical protein